MDFNKIAKVVNEVVQRQNRGETEVLKPEIFHGLNSEEKAAAIGGLSKLQGNTIAIENDPNVYWA